MGGTARAEDRLEPGAALAKRNGAQIGSPAQKVPEHDGRGAPCASIFNARRRRVKPELERLELEPAFNGDDELRRRARTGLRELRQERLRELREVAFSGFHRDSWGGKGKKRGKKKK